MSFPTDRLRQLTGHNGPVHCVTYSSGSGQYALTGCGDRLVRLFNASTSSLIQKYDAHGHSVLDIAVAADNARFASVGGDRAVFIWDVASARTLRRFNGHEGRINAVSWGGDGDSVVVSAGFDRTVRLWDFKAQGSTKAMMVLDEAKDSVTSVLVEGHEICTGSVDGRLRVYDIRMGMVYVDVIGEPITSVKQTKDGSTLLTTTLDSKLRLVDKANGAVLQTYSGHRNTSLRIRSSLALNDAVVLSGSEGEDDNGGEKDGGSVFVWDLLDGRVLHRLRRPHAGKVVSAFAVNDARREWMSGGGDGVVQIWGAQKSA